MKKRNNRIGETSYNRHGELLKIIRYERYKDVYVNFDGSVHTVHCDYRDFKRGNVRNPMRPIRNGIGYVGIGKHKSRINNRKTKMYRTWSNMFTRCYSEKAIVKRKRYELSSVCNEWHSFQNFGDWYDENYYEIDGELMCLDKDILNKGNKLYSPENCVFVPNCINVLFCKSDKTRGDYPIGVFYSPDTTDKYRVQCNNQLVGKQIMLGQYPTPELAFEAYKEYKENHIKEVADYYKDKIPNRLYDAMYRYEVEITD